MEAGIVPHRPHVTIAVTAIIVALQLDCESLTVDLVFMIESQQSEGCACMHLAI